MANWTMVQAINSALREEMRRDPNLVLLGEDVGTLGGVFRCTEGLLAEFGAERVADTPLNEVGIVGAALGMAMTGVRAVAEIQFADFIYPAIDQIINEVAKARYRSGGQFSAPLTIRAPSGGGIRGGHYHSQSPEAYLVHTSGLKVVIPSNPHDAKGLLKSAIRDPDPVIFLEPKKLYRAERQAVPEDEYLIPLEQAAIRREGRDVTVYCYGAMVPICMQAAEKLATSGCDAEVLDLRTLWPVDINAVIASVTKTGRAVIVHEAPRTCGYGAEIAALIAERCIDRLLAPIVRVAGLDTPFPYALEEHYLPGVNRVLQGIQKALKY